ncbi:acyl-CoA N-acyltransferase [Phellopilus nigrolimitatus]|nr:acyl-CoA N-acyltransferase [Phellopilus nigrolimitatus]
MSVSVAAVARGHVNGVEHTEEEWEQLSEPPAQSQSQPPTQAQTPAQSQSVEPHLSGETAVNGTATREQRKSTPKNFDKVNFGQWQIKTWYYSPYPLASVEEEEMSGVAGSSRHGMTGSSARGNHAKRGAGRGRARVPDVRSSNEGSILWVCDRCFKYMREGSMLELHSKTCQASHPPGRKVYGRGAHVIWEVDGAKEKLFCQNLSLFGKLFIDIKTLFFDCENFMFYLLTEGESQRDHVIGFFSKEKVSYDGYNLACIVTFPPYQRKRYGMLMIEFSYELSRRAGKLGTPERPLSELGLRSYLTFWTGAMVQFFRRILSVRPAVDARSQNNQEIDEDLIRFVAAQQVNGRPRKRRKSISNIEAWEGGAENMYHSKDVIAATSGANDVLFSRMRWMRTTANADGSVTTHVFARCTLEDISRATGLRIEDVAFTLHECGLLQRIKALDSEEMEEVIVISREMVEQIAEEFNVKKMCMEIKYVLV